jgi:2-polyprenyl-3-methyl-5-hydroxy-6-metoxy-1,4-benzoquinol methylase
VQRMSREKDGLLTRLIANLTAKTLGCESLRDVVFGQQNYFTQRFFAEKYGQYHTITVPMFPHYLFLENGLDGPCRDTAYDEYLKNSWVYHDTYSTKKVWNTEAKREQRHRDFLDLYHSIEARRHLNARAFLRPVEVCRRPDGKLILIDGNHRAAIALKLGIGIRAHSIPVGRHFRRVVDIPDEFYGSGRLSMPYQSIFEGDRELVQGRRPDVLARIRMFDERDLKGKSVLELGCNIGANCYLAAQAGARSVVGVDYSHRMITAAIRLNAYFALPCRFVVQDLNAEWADVEPADTTFCFSLINHLQNKEALVRTILRNTKHTLYFEGHGHTRQSDYDYLLNKDHFSSIEFLGHMRDGIHNEKRTRPLFRCEVAR